MEKGLVSVVVLNWNTLEVTKECLASLEKLNYPTFEIIVVDNGSTDGSKEYFSGLEGIVYIDLPHNTGFTGGQIAGLAKARGEFVALVNSDAVVARNWLTRLVETMDDKKVAATGGRAYLWNKDNPAYDESNPFYSYQVIDLIKGYAQTLMTGDKTVSVNSISGAGVLIRRSVIDKIGYFDDRFFAYYEETDLFARYKRAGYKVLYCPAAKTWHKIGASTGPMSDFYLYQMHRNRFLFAMKNFDRSYAVKFFRAYMRNGLAAYKHHARGSDEQAYVRALAWNLLHLPRTLLDRLSAQRLGETYSDLLPKDACQTISIVIPCYNYEKFVAEAIESALRQTQPALEIIVINDGSTDNSLEIINRYKDKVRVIDQKNRGIIATKNRGLEEAKGDWVIFLDADDYIDDDYLEQCLATARQGNFDLVYTDMWLFDKRKAERFRAVNFNRWVLHRNNYIHNSALMRRQLALSVGGYKQEMKHGFEDWEFYLTMSEAGMNAKYLPKPLLHYRQHSSNSRNQLAHDRAAEIYTKVYDLHPSLSQWSIGRALWTLKQKYRFYRDVGWGSALVHHMESHLITRKIYRFAKLAHKGQFKDIDQKLRRHARNLSKKP